MTEPPALDEDTRSAAGPMPQGYRRKLVFASLIMAWESLWRGLWPALMLIAAFVALALFGLLPMLPGWMHAIVLAGMLGGLAVLLWRGLRKLAVPEHADARRRLERASGLDHRPLQTLDDRMAEGIGDAGTESLWREHRTRMLDAASDLRVGLPQPGVAARDPLALRFAVALLVVIAAMIGWPDAGDRFRTALIPDFSIGMSADTAKLELWITPPAYTGQPPIFPQTLGRAATLSAEQILPAQGEPVVPAPLPVIQVPAGSTLTARISGGSGTAELIRGETRAPFERVDARNASIAVPIEGSGRLAVVRDGDVLGDWRVELVPDNPPVVAFGSTPTATERKALMITYTAGDDYGLERVGAEIRRSYERGTLIGKEVVALDLALPGPGPTTAKETSYHDLTPHRWAGMPVVVRLKAVDGIGQTAFSEDVPLVLPEREFRHPVARAIIEQRKRLTNEPERRDTVIRALGEIASRPGTYQDRTVTFLALSAAFSRLIHERGDEAIDPVGDLLWETALGVEDGRLSIAERELRRAQQDLAEALARNAPDQELERLMSELQRALDQFMRELAQQLRNRPDQQQAMPFDPRMRLLESTDLQRMMEQIRDLLRSGARDAARQMLAQLRNLLENLRTGRPMQANPQAQAGNQAMQELQKLIQRQSELMNRSFRQSQSRGSRPQPGNSRQGAMTQREIQQALKRLREALRRMGVRPGEGEGPGQGKKPGQGGRPGQGGGPGQAFEQADQNMGDAARALDRNAPGDSVDPQGRAIEALQRAGRGVVQQMMNQMGRRNGIGFNQPFNPMQQRRDPLGRYMPNPQGLDTRDLMIPDESSVERAQQILQELRRRAGQRQRPQIELDYIDRLLRRF